MPFTPAQQTALLAEKGVGKTVLQRLAQMGLDDVQALANADVEEVLALGALLTGSSCWKNSPQARAAIANAIAWAQRQCIRDAAIYIHLSARCVCIAIQGFAITVAGYFYWPLYKQISAEVDLLQFPNFW